LKALFLVLLVSAAAWADPASAPPYTQLEGSFLTSEPSAVGGELGATWLLQPVFERNLLIGPRLSFRAMNGDAGTILGLQAGVEGNLWLVNALGPGFAIDFVGPLKEGDVWLNPGWRVQGFALARFKHFGNEGAWALRAGMQYDSHFHWGILAGVSLQFTGVAEAYPSFLGN
jgi:hypothetical protein